MTSDAVAASAGYSGTPLHRKLGVRAGYRVLVTNLPAGFDPVRLDPDLTATVHRRAAGTSGYDVVVLFSPDQATLRRTLPTGMRRTVTAGRCWVAWPKQASGVPTDLTEDGVRAAALAVGWVDIKVCAVDQTWSGLCLVRRRENR